MSLLGYSQINVLNVENKSEDPNEQFINGISTRQDIGGVDIEPIFDPNLSWYDSDIQKRRPYKGYPALKVTNYNDFVATVLIQISGFYDSSWKYYKKVFTVTLPAASGSYYPSKYIDLGFVNQHGTKVYPKELRDFVSITRKAGGR